MHQTENDLSNKERIMEIINHSSIHASVIISIPNVTIGNQISASYVDLRVTILKTVRNWTLWKRNFTGTRKILKLVHID